MRQLAFRRSSQVASVVCLPLIVLLLAPGGCRIEQVDDDGWSTGTETSTASSSSVPFTCWVSGGRCDCKPNETASTGGTAVSNCTTALFDYCCQYSERCGCDDNPGCGSGGVEVAECVNDYGPVDPNACPGEGYVSCSDSSTCPCGLICERLSSMATDRYCTTTCASDDDCNDFASWSFSSVGCNPLTAVCTP